MTDRKKRGVAFWATAGLVVVLAYALSPGPVCWLLEHGLLPRWTVDLVQIFYWPLDQIYHHGPEAIRKTFDRYLRLW